MFLQISLFLALHVLLLFQLLSHYLKIHARPRATRLTLLSPKYLEIAEGKVNILKTGALQRTRKACFKLDWIFWMDKKIIVGFDLVSIGSTDRGGVKPSSICIIFFIFILSLVQLLIIDLMARSKYFWWPGSQNRVNQKPGCWSCILERGFRNQRVSDHEFQTITSVVFTRE